MSIKKVFKLLGVTNVEYTTKEGKEMRKVVDLLRYEKDAFGNVVAATVQANATGSFFPKRFNRNGELVANAIYDNLADTVGKQLFVTNKRFDTSPFNFPSDEEGAEPRNSINVMVAYGNHETETAIEDRLLKQAMYQLRELGVDIYEDGQHLGTSATANEWNAIKADAQAKAEGLRGETGTTTTGTTTTEFDAKAFEAQYVIDNPNATEDEVAEAVMLAEEAALAVNGAG